MARTVIIAIGATAALFTASLAPALAKVPLTMPPPSKIKMLPPQKVGPSKWSGPAYGAGAGFIGGLAIGGLLSSAYAYADDGDCYVVRKVVETRHGLRKRYVTVCE
jgi:hypothetical protein